MFEWVYLPCNCCDSKNFIELGYRGGEAHKNNKGQKCKIVKCSSCGHIYPNPMPIVTDINKIYNNPNEYFIHHNLEEKISNYSLLLKKLEKKLGYKGKILDVGSGRGELLYAAKNLGWEVYGIELSKEFVQFTMKNYGIEVKNCSLEAANYPEEYFDIVVLNAVLEHLYYPKQILIEINRILKKNKFLWMNLPNEGSLYNIVGNLYFKFLGRNWVTNLSPTFSPYHVQGFTKNSIKTILLKTGFKIENIETFSGILLLKPHSLVEYIEFYGVFLTGKIANLLKMGSYMDIIAKKL